MPTPFLNITSGKGQDYDEDIIYWEFLATECRQFLTNNLASINNYNMFCAKHEIALDDNALSTISDLHDLYQKKLTYLGQAIAEPFNNLSTHQKTRHNVENLVRGLHQLRIPIARCAAWVCEAYNQSISAQIFHNTTHDLEVHYDRYESARVNEIETDLKQILNIGLYADVLATSSGMAAYTIIDHHLRNACLQHDYTVLIVHDLYSEVIECALKGFKGQIIRKCLFDEEEIIAAIEDTNARVVYMDQMQNREGMRVTDIEKIIDIWNKKHSDKPIVFVIDGTMTTGSLRHFDKPTNSAVVLYYSSCCKYMQLGQDNVSAGFIAFPKNLLKDLKDVRRVTGTILYDTDAWAYPNITAEAYNWRMLRMQRNALLITDTVNDSKMLSPIVEAVYPKHETHKDFLKAQHISHTGGLLTFRFKGDGLAKNDLDKITKHCIKNAKKIGLDLINGESFGFGIPRIYVGWTPSNSFKPFLRLSVGDRTIDEVLQLSKIIEKSIIEIVN